MALAAFPVVAEKLRCLGTRVFSNSCSPAPAAGAQSL
jgi:hypothetical protein